MNKVIIALLAGFAAGILLAPDKGSVTRQKVNDGLNDLADRLSGLAEKFTPENSTAGANRPVAPKMSAAL